MDIKKLAENLGLDEDEYVELIELFVETGMSDLDKLLSAVKEKDPEKAAGAAHSIKGAAGNLGLMDLYEAATEMEEDARNGILDGVAESVREIRTKLEQMIYSKRIN
jgi:HPt (histidine-containing phosphotransfer) domain-containing protein